VLEQQFLQAAAAALQPPAVPGLLLAAIHLRHLCCSLCCSLLSVLLVLVQLQALASHPQLLTRLQWLRPAEQQVVLHLRSSQKVRERGCVRCYLISNADV
jgi:hypothetical protein